MPSITGDIHSFNPLWGRRGNEPKICVAIPFPILETSTNNKYFKRGSTSLGPGNAILKTHHMAKILSLIVPSVDHRWASRNCQKSRVDMQMLPFSGPTYQSTPHQFQGRTHTLWRSNATISQRVFHGQYPQTLPGVCTRKPKLERAHLPSVRE